MSSYKCSVVHISTMIKYRLVNYCYPSIVITTTHRQQTNHNFPGAISSNMLTFSGFHNCHFHHSIRPPYILQFETDSKVTSNVVISTVSPVSWGSVYHWTFRLTNRQATGDTSEAEVTGGYTHLFAGKMSVTCKLKGHMVLTSAGNS